MQAIGVNDAAGIGLIEVYDLDRGDGRFVNLSTRSYVGTGDKVMINGLMVDGPSPKKFLVRSIGPTLAQYNVNSTLNDPQLTVYDADHHVVATNNDWSTDAANITAANTLVGAFPFIANSKDAAIIVTLNPGLYSVVTSGTTNTSGVALVEVYELP